VFLVATRRGTVNRPSLIPIRCRTGALVLLAATLLLSAGCGEVNRPQIVFGQRGVGDGEFARPRAIAIDGKDRLYIVDFSARIQVFDRDGTFIGPSWKTPDSSKGRPSGLSIDRDGNLIVSDSHYSCFRIYSPEGVELRKIGGDMGNGPGQLGYISDVVQDADGFFYVGEFGENQRISKFDADGHFVKCWGQPGSGPGEFARLRAMTLGPDGLLYVADSCNHRIQVFDRDGHLIRMWGEPGDAQGQLSYPYDLAFNKKGELYVVERGNARVQKFNAVGQSLGCWGSAGGGPGQFNGPWGLAVDSHDCIHVLDTENHRVQRIKF
jgi:DNA-binding beta-propeller fold protein YncE